MATVTLTVSDDIKSELKRFSWINWSEVAREEVMRQEKRARLFEELKELTKDSTLTDKDCLKLGKLVKKGIWQRLQGKL
jgi:hypothetical protein